MYSDWASLTSAIEENIINAQSKSVLSKFSIPASKDVATTVIKQIATSLSIAPQQPDAARMVPLTVDSDCLWCMDVICYGLSLPLSEHETIKDCVNIYCEWLTALHPQPRPGVPKPIQDDANVYARKIIGHLHNLFTPRQGESKSWTSKHIKHFLTQTLFTFFLYISQSFHFYTIVDWVTFISILLTLSHLL